MEGPQVEIDARVLVGQAQADVLPAGGVQRGVAEAHRRELQRRSNDSRGTRAGDEIHHRRHRQLRLRHTDKCAHQRGIRVSQGGEEALEAELQGHSLEDAKDGHAEAVQVARRAGHRSECHQVLQEGSVANDQPAREERHEETRFYGSTGRAEEQGRIGERSRKHTVL